MKQAQHVKKQHGLEMICFGLLFLLKAGYHHFTYWPLLDDFIQYRVYSFYENPIKDVIVRIGLLSSRPFAGIFDVFLWAKFWDSLGGALFILTAMYGATCYLFYRILNKYVHCGFLFAVVLGLAPFLAEGTYWISASSRIVVSLFFGAISLYLLQKYIKKKRPGRLLGFFLFNLLSYGFYEQTAALCFVLILFILWKNRAKIRGIVFYIPFINGFIIAFFYLFVRTGAGLGAGRISVVKSNFLDHYAGVARQIWDVFVVVNGQITRYGIEEGLSLMWSQGRVFYLIAILAAGFFTFFIGRASFFKKPVGMQLLLGGILFLAALSPFFLLKGAVITLRCGVAPWLGLALMVDAVARGLFLKTPKYYGVLCAVVAVLFIWGSIAETDLYVKTGAEDQRQVGLLAQTLMTTREGDQIAIIGAPEYYDFNQIRYYEHSYSVFSSQWALSGAVRAVSDDHIRAKIYPIRPNDWIHQGYEQFDSYTGFLGYKEKAFIPLFMKMEGEEILFLDGSGQMFATAQKKDGAYFLQMPNT